MKEFEWSKIKQSKTVVHCKRDEIDEFLEIASKKGIFFKKKDIYVDCFNVNDFTSAPLRFYKTGNTKKTWTVIKFKDCFNEVEVQKPKRIPIQENTYYVSVEFLVLDLELKDIVSKTESFNYKFNKISVENFLEVQSICESYIKKIKPEYKDIYEFTIKSWSKFDI